MRLWQYAEECEGTEIWDYLKEVWRCMREAVTRGLETEGTLKGGLDVQRKAKKMLYRQNHIDESAETRENRLVCAYAYAVSEENAAGGIIVTAPTCGSCGVLPSVLFVYAGTPRLYGYRDSPRARGGRHHRQSYQDERLHQRRGVRLSGEIGSACSMAAAASRSCTAWS